MAQLTAAKPAHPPAARATGKGVKGTTFWFWVFVGPFLLGLVVFTFVPIGWSAVLSFFDAQNTVTPTRFVGLRNYVDLLTEGPFVASLWAFTLFALFIVPTTFALSLALAVLVHRIRFMRAFFRSVFFLPTACSYVVACLVWKLSIFNGVRFGLMNTVLGWFGEEPIAWIQTTDPPLFWIPIVTARLWLQSGFYMILFLAALQRIPNVLYEAAYVDGAKPGWQTFRFITFPQLRATSVAVLLLLFIHAYQAFDEFYNLLGNVPFGRAPLVYLYYTSLGDVQDFGHGGAGALILGVLIALVSLVQGRVLGFGRSADGR